MDALKADWRVTFDAPEPVKNPDGRVIVFRWNCPYGHSLFRGVVDKVVHGCGVCWYGPSPPYEEPDPKTGRYLKR